jgi:adenylosuccinate synthase
MILLLVFKEDKCRTHFRIWRNKTCFRTIPSGIFHKTAVNIIGNGVVIDPVVFQKKLKDWKNSI